jgi:hypothetical protein
MQFKFVITGIRGQPMRPAAERLLLLLSLNLCIDMVDYFVYVRLKARVEDEGFL